MHEIGIANSILDAVRAESALRPDKVPLKVAVRIGELAALNPDALQFCFETLVRDTELKSLRLEIEVCPPRYSCSECSWEFSATQFDSRCPECDSASTQWISGDQLELAYLEMEEYEPSTACKEDSE